jgi:Fe2+ or Zn2+ uptake regulation protein
MIDAELIQKFFDDKGQVYYEHIYEHTPPPPFKLYIKCNKITEFEDPDLHKFLEVFL